MQGTIAFDGTLSGSIAGGGGGGGSEVTITPTLTSGTKIADYEIDSTPGELYAPDPEALPSTIVTKVLREYNDTTQTKIAKVTTLDTSNNQEVSQDIYAPSPVQCWYTPGLEQDYQIGQFTYGGVTQNVYIPYFQRPLTAGTNITIDQNNVISASGGSDVNYSTTEQDTGVLWLNGEHIYQKTIISNFGTSQYCDVQISSGNVIVLDYELFALTEHYERWIPIPIGQNMNSDYMRVIEGYSDSGTGLRISKSHPTNFGYNTHVYLTARYIYI